VTLAGRVLPAAPGYAVVVQHSARGGSWRAVAATRSDAAGRYRTRVRLRRSGAFRALLAGASPSVPQSVGVIPLLHVELAGAPAGSTFEYSVSGRLLPASAAHRVSLESRGDGRWTKATAARTGRSGQFRLVLVPGWEGSRSVQVRFGGSRLARPARRTLGAVAPLRPQLASWYGPGFYGRTTACGQTLTTATEGVAHPSLPCGTQLTLWHGGRTVQAPVIDRGPFAPGRELDLTAATASALGFVGVDTVWASV
jgi:hypothetical protein